MKTMKSFITAVLFFLMLFPGLAAAQKKAKPDLWLEAQIVTSYALNPYLNPFDLNVEVKDGIANLSGTVENDVEHDLAIEIARGVDGIKKVKDNIIVKAGTLKQQEEESKQSEFYRAFQDATITAKVKTRLLWNNNTEGLKINVDTADGIVTLGGRVDSDAKRQLAVQLAKNTGGVRKVIDNLEVLPEKKEMKDEGAMEKMKKEVTDTWITGKIKMMLMISKEAEGSDIDVSTENGIVTLRGTVISKKQKDKIVTLAEDNKYVKEVRADLTVEEN
jgi:hyperosmotically inducible protein